MTCACAFRDCDGNLWVGTAEGLAKIAIQERSERGGAPRMIVFKPANGMALADVRAVCQDASGAIWIGGEGNQLSIWDGKRFTQRTLDRIPPHALVQALLCAKDGTIWAGTSDGLVHVDGDRQRLMTTADGLAHDSVLCLIESHTVGLWAGTKDGFSRLLPRSAAGSSGSAAAATAKTDEPPAAEVDHADAKTGDAAERASAETKNADAKAPARGPPTRRRLRNRRTL